MASETSAPRRFFAERLTELLDASALTQKQAADRASERAKGPAGRGSRQPNRVTEQRLSAWKHGDNLPDPAVLRILVRVLIESARSRVRPQDVTEGLLDEARWQRWLQQSRAVPKTSAPEASGGLGGDPGVLASQADPRELGVHRAAPPPGTTTVALPALPLYYARDHDHQLTDALQRAQRGESVFAVLVGESATGKTRALYEAVLAAAPHRRLIRPHGVSELATLLESGQVSARTVLWLDEAQRFFYGQDGSTAADLLAGLLARGHGILAVGAIWERPYLQELTAQGLSPDSHGAARALLTGPFTRLIRVPDRLTATQREDFRELNGRQRGDPRIEAALAAGAADGRVIQHLTGGPELLDAYLHGSLLFPSERALVVAAIDARRLGHRAPIPAELLAAAADGYLSSSERPGGPGWARTALEALASGSRADGSRTDCRTLTALTAVRNRSGEPEAGFEPAHYLLQHAHADRPRGAAALWQALPGHAASTELLNLARAASGCGFLQIALSLYRAAAEQGDTRALRRTAQTLRDVGRAEEAAAWWRRTVEECDDSQDLGEAAKALRAMGRAEEAAGLLRARGQAGDHSALHWLAVLAEESGRLDDALAYYRLAAEAGDRHALRLAADKLKYDGRPEEALGWYRQAAEAGDDMAIWPATGMLRQTGRIDEAIAWLQQLESDGRPLPAPAGRWPTC